MEEHCRQRAKQIPKGLQSSRDQGVVQDEAGREIRASSYKALLAKVMCLDFLQWEDDTIRSQYLLLLEVSQRMPKRCLN